MYYILPLSSCPDSAPVSSLVSPGILLNDPSVLVVLLDTIGGLDDKVVVVVGVVDSVVVVVDVDVVVIATAFKRIIASITDLIYKIIK